MDAADRKKAKRPKTRGTVDSADGCGSEPEAAAAAGAPAAGGADAKSDDSSVDEFEFDDDDDDGDEFDMDDYGAASDSDEEASEDAQRAGAGSGAAGAGGGAQDAMEVDEGKERRASSGNGRAGGADEMGVFGSSALTKESVAASRTRLATQLGQVTGLDTFRATLLLKDNRWNSNEAASAFMMDSEAVCGKLGLPQGDERTDAKRQEAADADCMVCCSEIDDAGDMVALECAHYFCKTCWLAHVTTKMKEGNVLQLKCMMPKCNLVVPDSIVTKLADDVGDKLLKERYLHFLGKALIESNPKYRFCPGIDCPYVVSIDRLKKLGAVEVVVCTCGKTMCFSCGQEPHAPATCKMVAEWQRKLADEGESANWVNANTKPCPNCGTAIEKNGGCNHITCFKCNSHFCWICLHDWAKHGANAYNCNRYDPDQKAKGDEARQKLDRYIFYFDRFMAQRSSLRMEKNMKDAAERKTSEKKAETGNLPWIDNQYIVRATESLLNARAVLMQSYTLAFFLPQGGDKDLFEFQQSEVAKSVEDLSKMLEKPTDEIERQLVVDLTRKVDRSATHLVTTEAVASAPSNLQ